MTATETDPLATIPGLYIDDRGRILTLDVDGSWWDSVEMEFWRGDWSDWEDLRPNYVSPLHSFTHEETALLRWALRRAQEHPASPRGLQLALELEQRLTGADA